MPSRIVQASPVGDKTVHGKGRGHTPLPDTTPSAFVFNDVGNAALSTAYVSNEITVAGINTSTIVSVTGGEYSKNGGPWDSVDTTAVLGDTFRVRVTSSALNATAVAVVLTIGGVSDTYTVTTIAAVVDTVPDSFGFTGVAAATRSTAYTSNTVTISGLTTGQSVPVSVSGGTYSKNGAAVSSANTTATNGDTFALTVTSSANYATTVSAVLNVGGVTGAYQVTTAVAPADTVPDAFAFTAQTDVTRSTVCTSNLVTLAGLNATTTVAISGGEYSKNGGAYTSAAGSAVVGDTLRVQVTSSASYATAAACQLNVGGVPALFSVTTEDAPVASPTAEIFFGIKTRSGHGGFAMNLAAASAITGTGASDWVINAYGELTPSGTYGAAKTFTKTAGQSYSLTFADATTRTVTLVADQAHIAASPLDSATSFQLQKILGAAGALVLGDDVVCRDGHMNPTGTLWRISPPSGGWTGSGRITVRSENPTAGNDANGNPTRGGGFKIGSLAASLSTDVEMPVDFEDIHFYCDVDATRSNFFGYVYPTVGYGVGFTRCRAENGPSVSTTKFNYGFDVRGATAFQCHVKRCVNGITGGRKTGDVQTRIAECVFEGITSDAIAVQGQNLLIEDNFGFNFIPPALAHPDGISHGGAKEFPFTNFGTIRRNIWVLNNSTRGPQGVFLGDSTQSVAGCTVENEIYMGGAQNAIAAYLYSGLSVSHCTVLKPSNSNVADAANATIWFNDCTTSTCADCVANAYILELSTGTDNLTIAAGAATLVAFPNWPNTADPGLVTYALAKAAATPADLGTGSGGVKRGDNTFAGALDNTGAWA